MHGDAGVGQSFSGTNGYKMGDDPNDLRLAVQSITDYAIILLDPKGIVATWNPGAERIKGYREGEIVGRHFSTFYRPEAIATGFPEEELRVASEVGRFEDEGWRVRQDGSLFWANVVITAVKDTDGKVRGFVKLTRDLTERRQAEEALRRSEQRLHRIVESEFVGIFFFETGGQITYVNDAFLSIIGYTREDYVNGNWNWLELGPPEEREVDVFIQSCLQKQGFCHTIEKEFLHRSGQRVSVLISVSAIDDDNQTAAAFVVDNMKRKSYEQELERAQAELETRVNQRTLALEKANEELKLAKEEADAANHAKSEFLSRMSHELRTPLNAISGFGQILAMEKLSPLQSSSVEHILHGGEHLLRLVNEVLDIARVEAGKMDLSVEAVSVDSVIREAVTLVSTLAERVGVSIEVERLGEGGLFVFADRQRLLQVLINLLTNAIKYNRPRGLICVSAVRDTDKIRISVRDTGIGIKEEHLTRLFTPFERLDAAQTQVEGTGLGLALSKRMVDLMSGRLSVQSKVGKGSTFSIELPVAADPQKVLETEIFAPLAAPVAHQEFRILYIEDNMSNFELIEAILAHRPGVKLLGAMQGSIGIDLAVSQQPDLILLDVNLPDMNGADVLGSLRATPVTSEIPVIILSADATQRQIERLLALGAEAYLTKPLKISDFLSILDQKLGAKSASVTRA